VQAALFEATLGSAVQSFVHDPQVDGADRSVVHPAAASSQSANPLSQS
jgi:hypothetical protein